MQKWADYDPEFHFVDTFVMWDKRKAKLNYDRREKGLEKVIPEDTVQKYREHYPGCKHKFGDKECQFSEDKVFSQWKRLREKKETPVKAKRKGRKRGEKPRVVRKKLRLAGKEYQTGSGKTVKAVKEMEYVTCKYHCRCVENVSPEDRQTSYDTYWSTTEYLQRKQLLFDRLSQAYPKRRITQEPTKSRKLLSTCYYLDKIDEETGTVGRTEVCRKVFLATLQCGEKIIRNLLMNNDVGAVVKPEMRGSHPPGNKFSQETRKRALDHLNSFPKVESHYTRKSSTKLYIQDSSNFGKLTVSRMHELYMQEIDKESKEKGENKVAVGYIYCFNLFQELNIAIHKPKKDQCSYCNRYKDDEPAWHKKNIDQKRALHDKLKEEAKTDSSIFCFNFDLEAVLYTPCGKVSTLFYKRKLSTYNFTMYDLSNGDGYCYMWDQIIAKRGSNEMASLLFHLLESKVKKNPEIRNVVFFSDKCGGQNLNQFIATMYLYAVNVLPIDSIEHIFMVSVHSHMEVDSMHAAIERTGRDIEVRVPYEWEVVACLARAKTKKPYDVTHVQQEMVNDWKQINKMLKVNNVTKDIDGGVARWKLSFKNPGINWLHFGKNHPRIIFYKQDTYSESAPFKKIETISKRCRGTYTIPETLQCAYNGPIPIPYLKYNDLMKLCQENAIKVPWKSFYEGLICSNEAEEVAEDDEISPAQNED